MLAPVAGFIDPVDQIPELLIRRDMGRRRPNKQVYEKRLINEESRKTRVDLKCHRTVQSHKRFLWYNEYIIHGGGADCD